MQVAAGTAYALVYPRATQGTLLSHPPYKDPPIWISNNFDHSINTM
jgi:hypothetical protein